MMKNFLILCTAALLFTACKKNKPTAPSAPNLTLQFTGTASLGEARDELIGLGVGNKLFFAGGYNNNNGGDVSNKVDIFDAATSQHIETQLSVARTGFTAVAFDNRVFFAGGYSSGTFESDVIEIYDAKTGWISSTEHLFVPRTKLASAAAKDKILFAGGEGYSHEYSDVVDVYNTTTGKMTSFIPSYTRPKLSAARYGLAAAASGTKIVFAGGVLRNASNAAVVTNLVDVYDTYTEKMTPGQPLSEPRSGLTAIAAGNKLLFAGGSTDKGYSKRVDIYDVQTNTWANGDFLSNSNSGSDLKSAVVGTKVVFGGLDDILDIYDTQTGSWTTLKLSSNRSAYALAASGNKLMVAGGLDGQNVHLNTVDIFELK